MPSVHDDSPGAASVSSPGYPAGGNPEYDAALNALAAESDRAVDALAAAMHAGDYDAAMAALAAESHLAAQRLLARIDHPAGGGPAGITGTGETHI